MARRRRGRPVNGILVLDKPLGISSNRALQTAKALYFAAKAGHTGSLDPMATGVLPLCFGEATKFSQYLLDADKIYRATVRFGETTTTGDAEGEVVSREDPSRLTEADVEAALAGFRGEIDQVPPMYSALKKDGKPLYELARKGVEVEREARRVTIRENRLEAFRPGAEAEAELYIHCSKGTYIRTIAEDLGAALGCGAHLSALRRLQAGPYRDEQAVSIEQLEALKQDEAFPEMDALLQPLQSALGHLPALSVSEDMGFYLRQGQPVLIPRAPTEGLVALSLASGEFIGVGEVLDDGRVAPKRLIASAPAA